MSETGSRSYSSHSDKSESIFLPIIARRNLRTSQETGSGNGSEYGNSRFLFPAIPSAKKEWRVTPNNRSFLTKSLYKQTAFQNGDSQVSKTEAKYTLEKIVCDAEPFI